jgi:hypothetical protein
MRLEVLGQLKNRMTSLGIKAATFRSVAQCLNQLWYCVFGAYLIKHRENVALYRANPQRPRCLSLVLSSAPQMLESCVRVPLEHGKQVM